MSISRIITSITAEAALSAVQAAQHAAKARNIAVVAAVVDPGGHLVACLRADGAFVASIDIARDKAWTAAIFGASTDGLATALNHSHVLLDGIAARRACGAVRRRDAHHSERNRHWRYRRIRRVRGR